MPNGIVNIESLATLNIVPAWSNTGTVNLRGGSLAGGSVTNAAAGTTPFVPNLQATNVTVTYSTDYGVAIGTISVKIENYQYTFMGLNLTMPPYTTTMPGESAGFIPPDI